MSPAPLTDALSRSYQDLRWQADPAAASHAGVLAFDGQLGAYDAESVGEHLAACRSILGAIEELDVMSMDDEIDRTALLDAIRTYVFGMEHEAPHLRNPAFWLWHLGRAFLDSLSWPSDATSATALRQRLMGVDRFLTAACQTLDDPPSLFLDTAFALLPGVGQAIQSAIARFDLVDAEVGTEGASALEALRRFQTELNTDISAHPEAQAMAIGEEQFERRLRHEHALGSTAAEGWRTLMHLADECEEMVEDAALAIDHAAPWREVVEQVAAGTEDTMIPGDVGATLAAAASHAEHHGLVGCSVGSLPQLEVISEEGAFETVLAPWGGYDPPAGGNRPRPPTIRVAREAYPWIGASVVATWWGVPGAHLMWAGTAEVAQSQVRRQSQSSGAVGGWILYAGHMMEQTGFFADPGALLLHRAFRLHAIHLALVDIGLHTRGWATLDGLNHLTTHLPYPRSLLLADVRRIATEPTASLGAALGERSLLVLHEEWREAGHLTTAADLHRALFRYGGISLALAQWGLRGEP